MKNIEAVKMVREIRDQQQEELKNKSSQEQRQYFDEKAGWAFGALRKSQDKESIKIEQ